MRLWFVPMELRQVEYVLAVIEHGGFTRAAEALHVAQPTLSHGIRTLEQELGVDLFDRVGRGVRLSAAGRAFAPAARRARQDLAAARDAARDVAGLEAGELSIMALPTLVVDPLVAWVGAMRAAHPGVQVRIVEAEEATAVPTAVRDGLVDLGLAELDDVGPPLVTEVAVDQELLVIAPPGADLGATVTLSRLASLPVVATPAGTSTRRLLDRALEGVDATPTLAVEVEQREAILPLVLAGAGVSVVPPRIAEQARRAGAVVARPRPVLRRAIGVVRRPGPPGPAAAAFLALVSRATRGG